LAQEGTYTLTERFKQFGISRQTAYKWVARYKSGGLPALEDRSRSPKQIFNRSAEALGRLVVKERALHATWDGKKIQTVLRTKHGIQNPPCVRTVDAILKRHNLVQSRRRRGTVYRIDRKDLTIPLRPHHVLNVDFKEWFQTISFISFALFI
jgi:transposase